MNWVEWSFTKSSTQFYLQCSFQKFHRFYGALGTGATILHAVISEVSVAIPREFFQDMTVMGPVAILSQTQKSQVWIGYKVSTTGEEAAWGHFCIV